MDEAKKPMRVRTPVEQGLLQIHSGEAQIVTPLQRNTAAVEVRSPCVHPCAHTHTCAYYQDQDSQNH